MTDVVPDPPSDVTWTRWRTANGSPFLPCSSIAARAIASVIWWSDVTGPEGTAAEPAGYRPGGPYDADGLGPKLGPVVQLTIEADPPFAFECEDTIASAWVSQGILQNQTYPVLPFVDDVRVVVDAGGNCGAAAVHFARHYPEAVVHTIEPGSLQRAILERNACLLYTSPSPRDSRRSRMPSSA